MEFASFNVSAPDLVVATAIHNGHEIRPDLARLMAIDEPTRLREEDPHTGALAARFANNVVAHRSRFEVDLNRERDEAVYRGADDAWGLEVWKGGPGQGQVTESLRLYDAFYADMSTVLDRIVAEYGGFVLYDIHSYNHRRSGPDAGPEPADANPTVNLGTGSLPEKWKTVAEAFVESVGSATMDGAHLDVRENVRFRGRRLAAWVHDNYGEKGCALAIEVKKVYMDEWTGALDMQRLALLGEALVASADAVRTAWEMS
jgi:N-formylglutamate amidohydrolase